MTKNIFIYLVVILLVGATAWLFFQKARKSSDSSILNAGKETPQVSATPASSGENWVTLPNGLKILDVVVGPGREAREGDVVSAHYAGTLPNGTKFDNSYDRGEPFSFILGSGMVIRGWDVGIVGMKVGGKRKLIIPPDLAYGDKGAGGVIPPNAILHFDVELMAVETPQR